MFQKDLLGIQTHKFKGKAKVETLNEIQRKQNMSMNFIHTAQITNLNIKEQINPKE